MALAITGIGAWYLASPKTAMRRFGLPLPGEGANIEWWLRLKGSRDIVSGLVVLAVMLWAGPWMVGTVLLVEAMIPVGDMLLVLAGRGSARSALGIHGVTALLMVLTAIPLLMRRP